jgi:hypothetical protein
MRNIRLSTLSFGRCLNTSTELDVELRRVLAFALLLGALGSRLIRFTLRTIGSVLQLASPLRLSMERRAKTPSPRLRDRGNGYASRP